MEIKTMQISQITPAGYNPRMDQRPGEPVYERLKESIQTFGLCQPLVFNRATGHLVGGHQRLTVLKDLGYTQAEVVLVELPLEQEKVLNIALNKVQGDWDQEKLGLVFDELTKIPDFDVGLTGFEGDEISDIVAWSANAGSLQTDEDLADVQEAVETRGPAVTRPGDVIELGSHRLMCGDPGKLSALRRLIGDDKAQLLVTDMSYAADNCTGSRSGQDDHAGWLGRVLKGAFTFMAAGAPVYIWCGDSQLGMVQRSFGKSGIKLSCVITWAKESPAAGSGDYGQQTESCLYGWMGDKAAHRWYGPANESTLWNIDRDLVGDYGHPAGKPLELAERGIRNSSLPGQVVLDTFLGGGATLIAAEKLSRRCLGVDSDAHRCDAIVRRWIAFVGADDAPPDLVGKYCDGNSEGVKS